MYIERPQVGNAHEWAPAEQFTMEDFSANLNAEIQVMHFVQLPSSNVHDLHVSDDLLPRSRFVEGVLIVSI